MMSHRVPTVTPITHRHRKTLIRGSEIETLSIGGKNSSQPEEDCIEKRNSKCFKGKLRLYMGLVKSVSKYLSLKNTCLSAPVQIQSTQPLSAWGTHIMKKDIFLRHLCSLFQIPHQCTLLYVTLSFMLDFWEFLESAFV